MQLLAHALARTLRVSSLDVLEQRLMRDVPRELRQQQPQRLPETFVETDCAVASAARLADADVVVKQRLRRIAVRALVRTCPCVLNDASGGCTTRIGQRLGPNSCLLLLP